jgi:transposase-like protein
VAGNATRATCKRLVHEHVPRGSTVFFYTDESSSYKGVHPQHATVNHGQREWARDDDGDGWREVHCNSCEGRGAAVRTYLRTFRGVHKDQLYHYLATYEALANTKIITPTLVQRMAFGCRDQQTNYT